MILSDIITELKESGRVEFEPGTDFAPVVGQPIDWVPYIDGSRANDNLLSHESPVVNWVNADPNSTSLRNYTVEKGWSLFATRLTVFLQIHGVTAEVAQHNHRNAKGEIVRTVYAVELKEDE